MDDVQTHTHKCSFFSTTTAVIAGLNTDNQWRYTRLAAATVSGHLPGNVPIRALTVNYWLVQWLYWGIYTSSSLDWTGDSPDLISSDVLMRSVTPLAVQIAEMAGVIKSEHSGFTHNSEYYNRRLLISRLWRHFHAHTKGLLSAIQESSAEKKRNSLLFSVSYQPKLNFVKQVIWKLQFCEIEITVVADLRYNYQTEPKYVSFFCVCVLDLD